MSTSRIHYGPTHPRLGRIGRRLVHPALRGWAKSRGFFTHDSSFALERSKALREKLARGESAYLLGLGLGGHDTGAALVEVSSESGIHLISSHEEERFVGERHYAGHPSQALREIRADLDERGLVPGDIHACLASFDYVELFTTGFEALAQEAPRSLPLLHPSVYPDSLAPLWRAFRGPRLVAEELFETRGTVPVIGMLHHENHAAFSWSTSPFALLDLPTLIFVTDANGDDTSFSVYRGTSDGIERVFRHPGIWESLGHFYAFLSSDFGGWPIGQAEGRWMAAAAFGSRDPARNPFYPILRSLISVNAQGGLDLNRDLAAWQFRGGRRPFKSAVEKNLRSMLGRDRDSGALSFTYEQPDHRVADLAAASQLVFEETLEKLVGHWTEACDTRRFILTGGTALNCVANARLQRAFRDNLPQQADAVDKDTAPGFWTPSAPADEGTLAGCAMAFALRAGARPGAPATHAFYCGRAPTSTAVQKALGSQPEFHLEQLELEGTGRWEPSTDEDAHEDHLNLDQLAIADLLALAIDAGAIIGLFRGRAEMGRRSLGHRSILASPRSTYMRDRINNLVKFREPFRPLAPICTTRAALRWFEIPDEVLADPGAYRWMSISAKARAGAAQKLPAAVHQDGSARLQIIDRRDRLLWDTLERLGEISGAEVALNTSLNVASPIAQTPEQIAQILRGPSALDAIFFLTVDGDAFAAWRSDHGDEGSPPISAAIQRWRKTVAGRFAASKN